MRLIDADALEKRMYVIPWWDNRDEDTAIDEIYHADTIDAVLVVHGRWVNTADYVTTAYGKLDIYRCSECGADVTIDDHDTYCPNCGARMDGDAHE